MRRLVFIIMCAAIAMTAAASNDDIKLWSDGPLNWSDFHQMLPPTSSEPSRLEVELSATPLESGDRGAPGGARHHASQQLGNKRCAKHPRAPALPPVAV